MCKIKPISFVAKQIFPSGRTMAKIFSRIASLRNFVDQGQLGLECKGTVHRFAFFCELLRKVSPYPKACPPWSLVTVAKAIVQRPDNSKNYQSCLHWKQVLRRRHFASRSSWERSSFIPTRWPSGLVHAIHIDITKGISREIDLRTNITQADVQKCRGLL